MDRYIQDFTFLRITRQKANTEEKEKKILYGTMLFTFLT